MKTAEHINIHRHAGNVALSFEGNNQTVYLSQEQAAWLAKKLNEAVLDIEHRTFSASRFESSDWPRCKAPLEALHRACSKGEAIKEVPAPHLKRFTVVTVSSNTNSFGYKSVLCLAPDGEGFEGLVQAYGTDPVPVRGEKVLKDDPRWYAGVRQLKNATRAEAKKILSLVK